MSKLSRRPHRNDRANRRSKAQREMERYNRERLAQAREDPNKVDYPKGCSVEGGCHRPASVAVIVRHGVGKYQGWSACSIHFPTLLEEFSKMKDSLAATTEAIREIPGAARPPMPADAGEPAGPSAS